MAPNDARKDTPKDTQEAPRNDDPQDAPENARESTPEHAPDNSPEDIPADASEDTSAEALEDRSTGAPEDTSEDIRGDALESAPDDASVDAVAVRPHSGGSEPDYRFTLANERTFLAWLRTALGLLAGGVAVHQLIPAPAGVGAVLAGLCVLLAALLAATAYPRWRQVQIAMRAGEPLPRSPMIVVLTAGLFLLVVAAAVLLALS